MKKIVCSLSVIAISVIGTIQISNAQPFNNSCANATTLIVNVPCTNGLNNAATLDGPAAQGCWAAVPDHDVWYTFTTGAAGTYTVTTDNGLNTDMQLKIYSGTCGSLTEVACNDDVGANGVYTLAAVASATGLLAGTTYYVQADVYGTTQGSFCIAVRFTDNNNCANATPIPVNGGCVTGSNYGATIEGGENTVAGCWGNAANATVWYSFTTAAAATYFISTDNGIPNTDTQIKIYSAPCGTSLQQVACNEDGGSANTLASVASAALAASTTYYVQVDLYGTEIGSFCISVSYVVNDLCANAINLTVGAPCTNGNNFGATTELGENTAAGCWTDLGLVPVDHTVWYRFTTGVAGLYTVSTDNGGTFDSQLKLYTACGSLVDIACDEDGGAINTLSSVICAPLAAGTTYLIQVDGWADAGAGGAMGNFCINVNFTTGIPNDCINNAIDITSLITPVNNTTNPFDCNHNYVYSTAGGCGGTTKQNVVGDPNFCNGSSTPVIYTPYPDHYDVWYKFTVTALLPPTYLHLFEINAPFLAMGLYGESTPGVPPVSICPAGNITGLTYIDCSSPDVIYLPPPPDPIQGQDGGARDEGDCTTPIHARIDISGLANGTYYVRVWEYAGLNNPPTAGTFNLCAESIPPVGVATDECPGGNIGDLSASYNVNVSNTFATQSNAGMHGNSCNTNPNEPQLSAAPAGQSRNCSGAWTTYVGSINNVINNTAIYSFRVAACGPGCEPTASVRLNNILLDGTIGNVAQLQVLAPGYCNNSANPQTVMNGATASTCFEMRPLNNAPLPNGIYSIVVDGQDGQLVQYDLTLTLDYPCPVDTDALGMPCLLSPLPVEWLSFKGESQHNGVNKLVWVTGTEINSDYFEIQRSITGSDFTVINKVNGAGTSSNPHHYISYDKNAPEGISYYRLKQVDLNGDFAYSQIISINNENIQSSIISISAIDKENVVINYYSTENSPVQIRIYDLAGIVLVNEQIGVNEGSNRITLNVPHLKAGVYIAEVLNSNNDISRRRFVKD